MPDESDALASELIRAVELLSEAFAPSSSQYFAALPQPSVRALQDWAK